MTGREVAHSVLRAADGNEVLARRIADRARLASALIRVTAPDVAPYDYQASIIDDWRSRLIHWSKPRQIGASFTFGNKGMIKGLARPGSRALYLSLSLEDAREKIDYAAGLHEAMSETCRIPKIEQRSVSAIRLANGSRLNAVFYPRGKSRADLYLDEFAHHPQARKMYRASTPILILGGQLIMASTVLTGGTLFSEIGAGAGGKFRTYRRVTTDWWDCPSHCRDVAAARQSAAAMSTEDRVKHFGTPALLDLYESMPEDDFRCEFERVEIGDDLAWLPWSLIHATIPTGERSLRNIAVGELEHALASWPRARLFVGYDVGRRRDSGALTGILVGAPASFARRGYLPGEEEIDDEMGSLPEDSDDESSEDQPVVLGPDAMVGREVMSVEFANESFDTQEGALRAILDLPRTHVTIDETGMGMQMAERLVHRYGPWRVKPINFSAEIDMPFRRRIKKAPAKMALATTLKEAMQSGELEFQVDTARAYQMHSIRRRVTEAANLILVMDSADDAGAMDIGHHHADFFWSRAMAAHGLKMWSMRPQLEIVTVGGDDDGDEDD